MATFSQQFLANLGRPQMAESLFGLGQAIGGVPGQIRERRRREEELARFNQLAQTAEQGTAAAIEGNVEELNKNIAELSRLRDAATTLEEKNNYQRAIANLQSKIPGAKQVSIGNKARELVNIEQMLQDPSLLAPKKAALQQRLEVLQKDPEAMQQYQKYQMDTWRFEQAQEDIKAEEWLDSNRAAILDAVEAGDTKTLNTIIDGAGEHAEAAQKFTNSALQNAENIAKFEENSIERKVAPSVDYYTEQVNNLPEEIRKNLQTTLNAYTKVSEDGWDGKQWKTGSRIRAKQLERDLQSQLRAINSQIATSEYFATKREEKTTKEQIKKLQLKIDAPMDSSYVVEGRRMASAKLDKGDVLTEAAILQEAEALYQRDRRQWIQQLADLTGEEVAEEIPDSPAQIIAQAMLDNPKRSREEIINALIKRGDLPADYSEEQETKELSVIEKRVEKQKQRFSEALGTREERMQALGPRDQRMASLFQ